MNRDGEALRQQQLVHAVLGGVLPQGLRGLAGVASARGLLAYRAHAQVLAAQALAAVFPRLQAWLGEAEFAAMAWAFWRACPPERGDLACWGQALPGFLEAQPGMERLPPDCARLEWAAHSAERAADAELDAASLQALSERAPEALWLRLRPGLSLLELAPEAAAQWPLELEDSGAAALKLLVWRRHWRAEACVLAADWGLFTTALLQGQSLQQALDHTLAAHPGFDFAAWLQAALSEAWLQAVETTDPEAVS